MEVVESGYGATLVVLRVMGCFGIARLNPAYVMLFVQGRKDRVRCVCGCMKEEV